MRERDDEEELEEDEDDNKDDNEDEGEGFSTAVSSGPPDPLASGVTLCLLLPPGGSAEAEMEAMDKSNETATEQFKKTSLFLS